jgi:hypothetical protein
MAKGRPSLSVTLFSRRALWAAWQLTAPYTLAGLRQGWGRWGVNELSELLAVPVRQRGR